MSNAVSSVASVASPAFIETAKAWIAYIGVLATAGVIAWGGVRKALRDLKASETNPVTNPHPAAERIVGGMIMDTTTMLMRSESNRSVVEALEGVVEKLTSLVTATNYNTEADRDTCKEIAELRHQIERLRDKLS